MYQLKDYVRVNRIINYQHFRNVACNNDAKTDNVTIQTQYSEKQ